MNIASLLIRAARVMPERTAVFVGTAPEATYGELAARANALGSNLRRNFALAPNERVALIMSNCGAYLQCLFACWHVGLICVPANAKLHAREIAFILENSGARVALVTPDLAATLSAALGFMSTRQPEVVDVTSVEFERM